LIKIFKLKSIISIKDFERKDIDYILDEASKLEDIAKSKECCDELKGKILGLMFFEPSTRTRLSFETSMKRLGGNCIGIESTRSCSVSKGESIADTAKMFEGYSDALVIRHELEGVSKFISDIVDVPVINAGDGAGQHPTQTLLDLYTIKKELGQIDNLKIAVIIGPEGGIDKKELEELIKAGAKTITLGKRILRTETASIVVVSNLIYEAEM